MIVHSKAKQVIVLKAIGLPSLRIFPGHNEVNREEFPRYFENNQAALAQRKENFSLVENTGELSDDQKKLAKIAKEKNTELNKAQKIVKKSKKQLAEKDGVIANQSEMINEQNELIKSLKVQMKNELGKLKSEIDELKKPKKVEKTEKIEKSKKAKGA